MVIDKEQSYLDMKESAGSIRSGPEKMITVNIGSRTVYWYSKKFHYHHRHHRRRHDRHNDHHLPPVAGDGERDGESVREPGDEIELILLPIV